MPATRSVIFVSLTASICLSCGPGRPEEEQAENAVHQALDRGDPTRIAMVSFQKTDGRESEVSGIPMYTIMFDAEVEFVQNSMFSIGGPMRTRGSKITTAEYTPPSDAFSWRGFLGASQGFRPAMKGDRLQLSGEVQFERRESGWTPTTIQFQATHDASTRDMDAIRRDEALRKQEEDRRKQQEAARIAQLAKEQAERDAAAYKRSFVIRGPTEAGTESGSYYIGPRSAFDAILLEPVAGNLRRIAVLVSTEHTGPVVYSAGDHLRHGALGGGGPSYDASGVVRAELTRSIVEDYRQVFVKLEGSGLVEVRVTTLCYRVEGTAPCEAPQD